MQYHVHAYIDTGASICVANRYVFPEELWEKTDKLIKVRIADNSVLALNTVIRNVDMITSGVTFQVPTLYQQDHPGPDDQMIIETDASKEFWGAVLKAKVKVEEGEQLCRFTSGSFQGPELNYHINEKEYLAVKREIKKFAIYVISQKFIIRTDDKNFGHFLRTNISGDYKQGRLIRWQQWFNHYKFDVEHLQGNKNCLADVLSRDLAQV
jgi:hypothetical protein